MFIEVLTFILEVENDLLGIKNLKSETVHLCKINFDMTTKIT